MYQVEFLKPRLVGLRFAGHAIPLEFLKDLAALEGLIIEVSKWQFLQEHPDRRRTHGLSQGVELRLTGVEAGSAIANISLFLGPVGAPERQRYLEAARGRVFEAIRAATNKSRITDHLPESLLGYFDQFGRGLREDESIELTAPDDPLPVRLTKESRRKLVLAAADVRQFTEETTIRGAIPEADQDKETFEVLTSEGRKIKAPLHPQHAETILEAFINYKKGARVLLKGIGRFNRQGRLEALDSVDHVASLDPRDIPARLDELKILKEGWLDGRLGKAPEPASVDWLRAAFEANYPEDLALPYLYPTAEGGIQAEWTLGKTEISLDIDLYARQGSWHSLDLDSLDDVDKCLDLDDLDSWVWLADQIRGGASTP